MDSQDKWQWFNEEE